MSQTHFYCEHCQNAVSINTDVCPYCGAIFSGIRCPSCDYSGSSSDFSKGCPVCGYITHEHPPSNKRNGKERTQTVLFPIIIGIFLVTAIVLSIWYKKLL